ncbi:hypothetical protein T4D_16896 [Trichinella pseudospiralis]|uniref:Uncharacterized protein n=1 Tax=Trichinella pseudospiralis TaxID=6337 RepID=A0A0V1F549_TRIPS|nr:hypothetical protein T4D_16896 [Trichinella pseudospiralis]
MNEMNIHQLTEAGLWSTGCAFDGVNTNSGPETPMYYPANGISEPYFNLYGTTGITRMMEITNPETSGSFHRPATAFAEQKTKAKAVILSCSDLGQFSKHYQTVKKCQPSQLAYY